MLRDAGCDVPRTSLSAIRRFRLYLATLARRQARKNTRRLREPCERQIPADAHSHLGGGPSRPTRAPTSIFIRQVLGAVAQLDKAMTVAKLRGARERKKRLTGQVR